jgi:hypothetical protein
VAAGRLTAPFAGKTPEYKGVYLALGGREE